MQFVYSPRYFADYGPHVFPIVKYQRVANALRQAQIPEAAFVEPDPATCGQILRVHTKAYLDDLQHCRWSEQTEYSELPLTPEIVRLFLLFAGGTIQATTLALKDGAAVHLGGGFHHAFAERAEGFCYLNDLAIAIRNAQAEHGIQKAMIIDCDLHQGNGSAHIFSDDDSVFTFSIHQECLYPEKQRSDLDIHLPNGVGDKIYLDHLHRHVPRILEEFRPELILYQAGVDPYEHDQLGDLRLTKEGLLERDRFVFSCARERRVPIAVTLGGGYAFDTDDTVVLHLNTCLAAWKIWESRNVHVDDL